MNQSFFAGICSQSMGLMGNIAWAFTTLAIRDLPLLDALAAEATQRMAHFNVQGMANTAWALAKVSYPNMPFFHCVAANALATMSSWDPQAIANLSWANATIAFLHEPLMAAISERAVCVITEFTTQNLSNSIWAYATLRVEYDADCLNEPMDMCSLSTTRCALLHRGRLRVNGHQLQLSAKALEAACSLLRGRSLEDVSQEFSEAQEAAAELLRVGALEKSRPSVVDFDRICIINMKVAGCLSWMFSVCSGVLEMVFRIWVILRSAHSEGVTSVGFVPEGVECNLLITRSLDNTMKIWDCRMLSDAKGPVKVFDDLRTAHEKTGVCTSPDGRYVVTGTSLSKNALGAATLRVYDVKTMSLAKSLDFGKKSVLQLAWPKDLNQILATTTAGDVVMLYSPFSSRKGALHFVGKKAKTKSAFSQLEEAGTGPIFNMTDPDEIKKFYSTGHGDMYRIRRSEARAAQKTLTPTRPEELGNRSGTKMPDQKFGDFAALALKAGAKTLHLNSTRVTDSDSQKALLEYQDKISAAQSNMLVDNAYSKTQPNKILDFSEDVSEGDKRPLRWRWPCVANSAGNAA
eukprot:s32_g41.t1